MSDTTIEVFEEWSAYGFWPDHTAGQRREPDNGRKGKIFLCRCGASTNKPFCDGTHSKIGFNAAAEAVPESAE